MPFINSKVSFKLSTEEELEIKKKLGEAISLIPGKSEAWLMVGFEDEHKLYFKGQAFEKIVFVEVSIFGNASKQSYDALTKAICDIYNEVTKTPKENIYVRYQEIDNWGWNGSNF